MSNRPAPSDDNRLNRLPAAGTLEWRKEVGGLSVEAGIRYSELLPHAETGAEPPFGELSGKTAHVLHDTGATTAKEVGSARPAPEAIIRWEGEGGTAC